MSVIGDANNYDSLVSEGIVLVDFYANWCGPCKMLSPILDELDDNIKVVRVDVDKNEEFAKKYNIFSIPTLFLYKNGKLVGTKNGFVPKPILESWINE